LVIVFKLDEFGPFRKFSEDLIPASLSCRSPLATLIARAFEISNDLAGQEGGMSTLDLAVMGCYSFVGLVAIGLIFLLTTNRH
jgi:hypothetical protein